MKATFLINILFFTLTILAALPYAKADRAGGGGNVESSRVSKQEILTAIANSKVDLKRNISQRAAELKEKKREELERNYSKLPSMDFLLKNFSNLSSRIDSVQVEVVSDGPCLDDLGFAHDGSASAHGGDVICISASRLQEKLSKESYREKIGSIVLHEISHLAGADEAVARGLESIGENRQYSAQLEDFLTNISSAPFIANFSKAAEIIGTPRQTEEFGLFYALGGFAYVFTQGYMNGAEKRMEKDEIVDLLEQGFLISVAMRFRACMDAYPSGSWGFGNTCRGELLQASTNAEIQEQIEKMATQFIGSKEWIEGIRRLERISAELRTIISVRLKAKFEIRHLASFSAGIKEECQ